MEKTIYVNRPASRTWNRLGVNEAAVRWDTDAETLLSNERFTAISGKNANLGLCAITVASILTALKPFSLIRDAVFLSKIRLFIFL